MMPRVAWSARTPTELRSAERTLAILTAGGLAAVAIYFATTTETGRNLLGVTTSDLSTFTYRHRRRPLYPFETDATY